MVEGAAANRVAHPGDRSVTWGAARRRSQTSYQLLFNRYMKPRVKTSERFQSISISGTVVKVHYAFGLMKVQSRWKCETLFFSLANNDHCYCKSPPTLEGIQLLFGENTKAKRQLTVRSLCPGAV